MAYIQYTPVETSYDGQVFVYKWEHITENDTCRPIIYPHKSEKTVQLDVTNWGGGSIAIKGAVTDALTPETLTDVDQTDLIFNSSSAKKIRAILENTYIIQPVPISGTGMDVTVYILVQGR